MDLFNIKKKMEQLKEVDSAVEVQEISDPKEYSILERGSLDIASLVAPQSASWKKNHYELGDDVTRTLYIHTYPTQVHYNWLKDVLRFPHPIDVAFYIQPMPIGPFVHKMRQQASHDEAAIVKEEEDGLIINQRRVARLRDTHQFIEAIENDATRPFQVMVAMTLRAATEKELDRIEVQLRTSLNSVTLQATPYRHKQGFETTMPLMNNQIAELKTVRSMHTQGVMTMFPFSSADISHETGVCIGTNQFTGSPIIVNRFLDQELESFNTAIIGMTGSGKSFFAKLEILRWAYRGIPIITLDPSGEYAGLCENLGGQNVNISLDSEQVINPLDFSAAVRPGHNALLAKISFMIELLGVMLRSESNTSMVDPVTRQLFEQALSAAYSQHGYKTKDLDGQLRASSDNMPKFSKVYQILQRISKTNPDPMVQQRIQPLLAGLRPFVADGHLAPLFDRDTTVDLNSHMINFNYSNLPPNYVPMAMHMVLEHLRTTLFTPTQSKSGQHRLIYVDEAQLLMDMPETAHFLQHVARTCRKYGVGLTVMTQNVSVFLQQENGNENKAGQGILSACSIRILLKQKSTEAHSLEKAFDLTTQEVSSLTSARSGEGLIFVGDETGWFSARNMASELEYPLLTTTMTEVSAFARAQEEQYEISSGNVLSMNALPAGRDEEDEMEDGLFSFDEEEDPFA